MAVGLLREDLLSLPGVESADLDGDATAPTGVRVRLAPGVDAADVGEQVQRVLALHGLRSEIDVGPPPPSVASDAESSPTKPAAAAVDFAASSPDRPEVATARDALESLSVTEGRRGVTIEAQAGETVARIEAAGPVGPALDQAIVAAVAELLGTRTNPTIRSVDYRDVDDIAVLTVVVEEAGEQLAGSVVVDGGRDYALGRAVWAALSSR